MRLEEAEKRKMAKKLQATINAMQGLGKLSADPARTGLSPFDAAFPGHVFPSGAVHEFISYEPAAAASTTGFITALAGKFVKSGGLCLWIGSDQETFAPGLKSFGLEPDSIVFIRAARQKDIMWIIEESLRCEPLTAVIADIKELGFTESRRLQLAVEGSGVTGFIHRYRPAAENAVACTSRWKITPLASRVHDDLPGIGQSNWDVQLLKVRNGRPGAWQVSWAGNRFVPVLEEQIATVILPERHAI